MGGTSGMHLPSSYKRNGPESYHSSSVKSCRSHGERGVMGEARESKKIQGVGGERAAKKEGGGSCRGVASRSRGPAVSDYRQGRKDRSPTAAVKAHPAPAPTD